MAPQTQPLLTYLPVCLFLCQLCSYRLQLCKIANEKGMEGDYRLGLDYMHCLPLMAATLITPMSPCETRRGREDSLRSSELQGADKEARKTRGSPLNVSPFLSADLRLSSLHLETQMHIVFGISVLHCSRVGGGRVGWRALVFNGMCQLVVLGTIRLFCLQ